MFDLFENLPAAAPALLTAGALLGRALHAFMAETSDAELLTNRVGQILCVTRALAAAECLAPAGSLLIAGYSVGEMAAWGIAGIWSLEETLRLTDRRARLMDAAGGPDDSLGFVRGLDHTTVAALTARFRCAIAIVNPGRLFVIGGTHRDVEACCDAALAEGALAARPIDVRVASHTPRLGGAVAPFLGELEASRFERPMDGRTLVSAADRSIVTGRSGLAGLAAQVATTVDWEATLEALVERGADRMLELGPGAALAEMARKAFPALDIRALDDFHSLAGASNWIRRHSNPDQH
jgi:[acyl-carrier-protein] S-malonyltransferase